VADLALHVDLRPRLGAVTISDRMRITIAAEDIESPDAQRLIEALDAHLASRYPPEQRFGPNLKPAQLAAGLGIFLVARVDGRAVGCGAVRLLDPATVEVKRMYVEPDLRGRGVAREILTHLEAAGRVLGATRAVLETGVHQDEAIGLYRTAGYVQVACWGEYASSPTSVCFEKTI
jgi:putative acetyltransferase